MNTVHWHLVLNHFPIIGTLLAIIVMVYGLLRKNSESALLGVLLVLGMAVISVITMQTGEAAEEAIEAIAGINKTMLEKHEDAAKVANIILVGAGLLALISTVLNYLKPQVFRAAVFVTLLVSATAFGFMAYTGYMGGQIRHTEINGNAATPTEGNAATPAENAQEDDD